MAEVPLLAHVAMSARGSSLNAQASHQPRHGLLKLSGFNECNRTPAHTRRSFSSRYSITRLLSTRSCVPVSRSRTVTVPFSLVSPSMVKQ